MRFKPDKPGPGQESVWDYPRPPSISESNESIQVYLGDEVIASTTTSWRVCETSHPPTYYLPGEAFGPGALKRATGATWCEWKGQAAYYDMVGGGMISQQGAWTYPEPTERFAALTGTFSMSPSSVTKIVINDEVVTAQEGSFYGGWITSRVVGPFKGAPGTLGW